MTASPPSERVHVQRVHVREQGGVPGARRGDAGGGQIGEPVVEARVAERGREQGMGLEERLPVGVGERGQGRPRGLVVHQRRHSPTLAASDRPRAGAMRVATDVGVSA